jgi:hypothetical protein
LHFKFPKEEEEEEEEKKIAVNEYDFHPSFIN